MISRLPYRKVGVLMGGASAEREVSLKTGEAVLGALKRLGYTAVGIDVGPDIAEVIRREKLDMAFIALHGPKGEDGSIQGLLEILGIPYTGSNVLASALGMNKVMSRRLFEANGLLVPGYRLVERGAAGEGLPEGFSYPVVVKPNQQGSSVGVSIVDRDPALVRAFETAFQYDSNALLEEYIKGMEVHVGILGNQALGGIEIVSNTSFYDYEAKYTPGMSRHIFPARLAQEAYQRAMDSALRAHRSLGCSGYSRVDLIVDERGMPYVLEVNTLPGMTPTSLLPEIARGAGMDFETLIHQIIALADRSDVAGFGREA